MQKNQNTGKVTYHQAQMKSGCGLLSVVATPIGNLRDWTHRAIEVAERADVIACEDTRVTRKLLSHYGITTKTIAYHEHNAEVQAPKLLEMLEAGKHIALMSDAGTPLISDPGYRIVNLVQDAGIAVESICGASSVTAALSIAGLPTNRFMFVGFLPNKKTARQKELQDLQPINATLVVFESAKRLAAMLADSAMLLGARDVTIVREISKLHEEVIRGSLNDLAVEIAEKPVKGEIVVVIAPPETSAKDELPKEVIIEMLQEKLESHRISDAVKMVAIETGISRNKLYEMALEIKR